MSPSRTDEVAPFGTDMAARSGRLPYHRRGIRPRLLLVTRHDDRFAAWLLHLEQRHLADLRFSEVSRALRALSSTYVERRGRLGEGAALFGAGKRAAFALFYGPLHYMLVREIVRAVPGAVDPALMIVDLGCGTGASSAAWAAARSDPPRILGIDRHPWALGEAVQTYRDFGLSASTRQGDISTVMLPKSPVSILAAFTLNEMPDGARDALLDRLIQRGRLGDRVLIVEPLAGSIARWWGRWRDAVIGAGGRADEWRVRLERPALIAKLDRATSLDHRELTGRSLWLSG